MRSQTRQYSQSLHLEVLSVHDDIVETEQHGEPILDHGILRDTLRSATHLRQATLRRNEHDRDHSTKHRDSEQADLLVLADFAEVGDADGEISERAIMNDAGEVFLVETGDDLEGGARYPLCRL